MPNLQVHLREAARRLAELPTPELDAELILSFVVRKSREKLLTENQETLSKTQGERYRQLIQRRKQGEPIAYLTGVREFYGRTFSVNRSVLIPRPETEELIDLAASKINADHQTIADIGTGCGNIAITLKHLFPTTRIIGCDVSPSALQIAERNRRDHHVEVELYQGDLLQPLIERKIAISIVVANLPYLHPTTPIDSSIRYEPPYALFAPKGIAQILRLLSQLNQLAASPELLLFETDPRNENGKIQHPAYHQQIQKDLGGRDRFVILKLKQS